MGAAHGERAEAEFNSVLHAGTWEARGRRGTTPGAAEAHYGAANALAASVDPAAWALVPPRAAPPGGVPHPPTGSATSA